VALDVYRKKREFNVTSEPRGGKIKRGGNAFVIRKHAATRRTTICGLNSTA